MAGVGEAEEVRALYVGNLHPYVNEAMLQDIFSTLGTVTEVRILKDRASGLSQGSAFVKFDNHEAAALAQQTINGRVLYNKEVRIQWAFQKEKSENTSSHFHIFVGNLSGDVADPVLLQAFQHIGDCSDARVMWDHSTGRSKGFGFVSFRTKEAAERALTDMNGAEVGQWKVRCGWAHHKAEAAAQPLDPAAIDAADPTNDNVYIGNLSSEVTEEELRAEFEAHGEVTAVKPCHKGGYGFVTFKEHAAAVAAIVGMNGRELKGKAIKCSWGRHQPSRQQAPAAPPAYAALPGAYPAGGVQHMYGGAGAPGVPGMPLAGQPGMYSVQVAQGGGAYQPQLAYSVPGHAGPEYSMAPLPAANGQVYGQYAHLAAQQQQQAQPQPSGMAAPFPQMGAQAYGYTHLQHSAPQMSPGAQHSHAPYQAAYQGLSYAGQPGQLNSAAAPVAAQQPLGGQYYGGYYS